MFIKNPATDAIIILVIVLLIFGPKRIPMLGKELGRGLRDFKDEISTSSKDAKSRELEGSQSQMAAQDGAETAPARERAAQ
jgi:sec-independent protein translocase protein TatA